MRCQNCGSTVQDDAVFCDQCGARIEAAPAGAAAPLAAAVAPVTGIAGASAGPANLCPACGTENMPGEMFCADCGTPLQAPVPEPDLALQPSGETQPAEPAAAGAAEWVAAPALASAPEVTVAAEPVAAVPAAPVTLSCAACGAALEAGDRFCHACGAPVKTTAATPEPAAAAATAEVTVAAPAAAVSAALKECPACGAHVTPGESFCEFCGAALVAASGTAVTAAAQVPAADAPLQPAVAMPAVQVPPVASTMPARPVNATARLALVVVETGQELPLTPGTEVLVGREDPYSNVYPDVDLTPFGAEDKGVSRRHFKLTLAEGQYAVLDLNSTNYTWVNQQRLQPNVPFRIQDGDEIRAGRLKLVFHARP